MRTRTLLSAVTLTAAAFSATACGPSSTNAKPVPTVTVTASAPASAAPTGTTPSGAGSPAATQSDLPLDTPPPGDGGCTLDKPAAHHKIVQPTLQPAQNLLYAKDAAFTCDPNGGHWAGGGAEKKYQFATDNVKAQLATGGGALKPVLLGDLWQHIGDCLNHDPVQAPYSCSSFGAYDITLDGSGKIVAISEIWHS